MSQENVDVARRMLRAFNDGDVEAIVAECDPTVEGGGAVHTWVDPLYRGHEGVRRWGAAVLGFRGDELGSLEGRIEGLKEADVRRQVFQTLAEALEPVKLQE